LSEAEAEAVASLRSGIKQMAQIITARSRDLGKKGETVDAAKQKHESTGEGGVRIGLVWNWKKGTKDMSGRI
jgi:hypothetical protein